MKKVIIGLLSIMMAVGCSKSPEQKAKDLIVEDLKGSMNDFKSYEPIEFSKLDSNISNFDTSQFNTEINSTLVYQKTLLNNMEGEIGDKDMYAMDKKFFDSCTNVISKTKKEKESYITSFKPEFNGFMMSHKFRGNNKMGAKVINDYVYFFNKDLTMITSSDNLDK